MGGVIQGREGKVVAVYRRKWVIHVERITREKVKSTTPGTATCPPSQALRNREWYFTGLGTYRGQLMKLEWNLGWGSGWKVLNGSTEWICSDSCNWTACVHGRWRDSAGISSQAAHLLT